MSGSWGTRIVDSRWRQLPAATTSNPCTLRMNELTPVKSWSLVDMTMSREYAILDSTRHAIEVTESIGPLTFTVAMPDVYTGRGQEIATQLAAALTAESALSGNTWVYTVTYGAPLPVFVISAGGVNTFSLNFGTGAPVTVHQEGRYDRNDVHMVLGFDKTDTAVAATHTSIRRPYLDGWEYVLLCIEGVRNSEMMTASLDAHAHAATFAVRQDGFSKENEVNIVAGDIPARGTWRSKTAQHDSEVWDVDPSERTNYVTFAVRAPTGDLVRFRPFAEWSASFAVQYVHPNLQGMRIDAMY